MVVILAQQESLSPTSSPRNSCKKNITWVENISFMSEGIIAGETRLGGGGLQIRENPTAAKTTKT